MSVALATMDSAHGLSRLGMTSHHHHLFHPYNLHHHHHSRLRAGSPDTHASEHRRHQPAESPESSALRFSVANILRPDFGREAILTTRSSPKSAPIKVTPLPIHSPLGLPRDLSLSSSSRLSSPLSPSPSSASSHCGLASPVQRPGLSRSGSLESLASSRSSVAGSSINGASSAASSAGTESDSTLPTPGAAGNQSHWPAWIYCTRYSDRPSSGPRSRRAKKPSSPKNAPVEKSSSDEKRPRTAFSNEQLAKLREEFAQNKYLNEQRRQKLSNELGLNEQQIKIWFQNKRAKIKKASGQKNPLALQLMAQGLYNHSTVSVDEDEEEEELSR